MASPAISQSLKTIINARAFPTLPSAASTVSLLSSLRNETHKHRLNDQVWITLTTASLFSLNLPSSVKTFVSYLQSPSVSSSLQEKTHKVEFAREAGLKCVSFIGIAKVINNMHALAEAVEPETNATLRKQGRRDILPDNVNDTKQRGYNTWSSIYTPFHDKLISRLADSHPDLPIHILQSHYSYLLSDPPNSSSSSDHALEPVNVGRMLVSCTGIGCLRVMNPPCTPQLLSHIFGLRKCENIPEKDLDTKDVGENWRWLISDEGSEWILRFCDQLENHLLPSSSQSGPVATGSKL